ncbi:MAG TPA: DUF6159 family protein [Fimbriimonadaceae bacterium]|nr:DUF6159 family protein [Fimbriimonadaceae bacterium]
MGRFARSLALAKESYAVLRSNPQLTWFPVVSSMFTILLTISFMVPIYLSLGPKGFDDTKQFPPAYYAVMAVFYLCNYFIVIFFNTALVTCAHSGLSGGKVTFGEGIAMALKRLPSILGWTLIAATVGMILQMISERSGIIGKVVVALVGGAWNLITFFVIPVMVVERTSPVAAIKRSGSMLRTTWGENIIGTGGLGLIFFLLAMIAIIPIVLAFALGGGLIGLVAICGAVVYWLILATLGASLSGIYRTALYVYAATGEVPQAYSSQAMQEAFRQGKPNVINRLRRW